MRLCIKNNASRSNNTHESTTTRKAGGLDFTAVGGKRQGREVPQSLRVESRLGGIWKTQSSPAALFLGYLN